MMDFEINNTCILNEINKNYSAKFDDIRFHRDGGSLSYVIRSNGQKFFLRIIRPQQVETAMY